ncbi:MAG: alpha-D-ribose 1-methylphosphonate 5-triphosphate diphosphatase [Pseudomonadota bacterium]
MADAADLSRSTTQAAHKSYCWANAQLVLEDRILIGAIEVENGRIAGLKEGDAVPSGAIDCGGDLVMPGLIELHTDNLERHMEPRPAVDWPLNAALIAHDRELASTGITTVFDALRVGSFRAQRVKLRAYARKLADALLQARAEGDFLISHFLHLRAEICSETLLEELAEFGAEDGVRIVSLMDHTPGQRQFRDFDKLKFYWAKRRGFTDEMFQEQVKRQLELRAEIGDAHEESAVKAAGRLGAVLASHDDTTLEHVATSVANGVTFAEFPTTLEAAQSCRDAGIAIMMGAPNLVRSTSHSGNVSARDLASSGLIDALSSDYVPSALLLATMQLAEIWGDIPRAVACVTAAPARLAKLNDRGRLAEGLRADLIRVSMRGGLPRIQDTRALG